MFVPVDLINRYGVLYYYNAEEYIYNRPFDEEKFEETSQRLTMVYM